MTTFTQEELNRIQFLQDSINNAEQAIEIKPFNPNYLSDFKAYQLGMNVDEIDRLFEYRRQGKFINSAKQFQEVTKITDSLLTKISPYFKFPEWISTNSSKSKPEVPLIKKDINQATAKDLTIVKGIGEKLSTRIIKYRDKLQGFTFNNQLNEVWNLDHEVVNELLKYYEVKTPPIINKINVNQASIKDLMQVVYIDYQLAKKILDYKEMVAEIQSIEELKRIKDFPSEKFDRIVLYLSAE